MAFLIADPITGRPVPARSLDVKDGVKRLGWTCSHELYETNILKERMFIDPYIDPFPIVPVAWPARFIDVKDGVKIMGVSTDCYPLPLEAGDVNFVCKDLWAQPYGVTDRIRFKWYVSDFPITAQCFDPPQPCPYIYLHYDGNRTWSGSFTMANAANLQVDLVLTDAEDPDRLMVDGWPYVRKWEVTLSGCVNPPLTYHLHITKYYPLDGGNQYGGPLDLDCCDPSDAPDLAFAAEGFTNRARRGREVDVRDGQERYLAITCCSSDPDCAITACCGCDNSPYQWKFSVAGVVNGIGGTNCDCHNVTDYVVSLVARNSSTGVCTWEGPDYTCGAFTWAGWVLTCDPSTGFVTLSQQNTPGGGGSVTYRIALADWDCMGTNVMSLFFNSPHCTGWPATVLVSPVII